jgi:hypothetical protein
MPGRGNRRTLEQRLAAGVATGALRVRCASGAVRVRLTLHGRGLEAATSFARGEEIAFMTGQLCELGQTDAWPEGELFHVRAGACLLLRPPSLQELANLVNTAGGRGGNNAELRLDRRTLRVRLLATRRIRVGEPILAAYGAGYTAELTRRATPLPPPGGWVRCEACGAAVRGRALPRHRTSFACRRSTR